MADLPVGHFIRAYRNARKLSQRSLSIGSGLSASYVGKVESGEIDPSFRAFAMLAHHLGFTSREIVFLVKYEAARGLGLPVPADVAPSTDDQQDDHGH